MAATRRHITARQYRNGAALCLLAAALAWLGTRYLTLFDRGAVYLEDILTSMAPVPDQTSQVVVLTITEETLAGFAYRSPIDRAFLAGLIGELIDKGARLIGLDLLFDQPTLAESDARLADVLRANHDKVVIATGDRLSGLTDRQIAFQSEYLDGLNTGLADMVETDGVVRYIYPGRQADPVAQPSFVSALAAGLGIDRPVELERLHYLGASGSGSPIRRFDAGRLEFVPGDWLRDAIVLIGVDLPNDDRFRTPLHVLGPEFETMAGVEIHARALAQLVDGRKYPASELWMDVLSIAGFAAAGFLLPLLPAPIAVTLPLGAAVLFLSWISAFVVARTAGIAVAVIEPTLAFVLAVGLSSAQSRYREASQRRFLTQAFKRYVSPAVIDEIVEDPAKLRLGGKKCELSFVFCDLSGFTTLSENLPPERVVELLQGYFDGMMGIALVHHGTIDRLVGDGIAVLFGAPGDQPDHAARAVACALQMDRFCESYRAQRAAAGIGWGATRVGVHSGPAVVGNVGSQQRFHYTAHGDAVNTAARLEGANRLFGTRICISRYSADHSPEHTFRPVGEIVLKGKSMPLACVTPADDLSSDELQLYLDGYSLLQRGDADCAAPFESLLARLPADGLTRFHLERINRSLISPLIVLEEK